MRHVLVPLDDSEQAWEALEHAMWTFPDAEVTVLTVIDPTAGFPSGMAAPASAEVWYDSARERAEEHDVDAVVMGSHGRNGVVRVLLGSVAETVVRRSPVPVTVVR